MSDPSDGALDDDKPSSARKMTSIRSWGGVWKRGRYGVLMAGKWGRNRGPKMTCTLVDHRRGLFLPNLTILIFCSTSYSMSFPRYPEDAHSVQPLCRPILIPSSRSFPTESVSRSQWQRCASYSHLQLTHELTHQSTDKTKEGREYLHFRFHWTLTSYYSLPFAFPALPLSTATPPCPSDFYIHMVLPFLCRHPIL